MRIVISALCLLLMSCSPTALQIQARTANAIALAADDLLPVVVHAYRTEGLAVIQAAPTRASAISGLEQVRFRWRHVWGAELDGSPCMGTGNITGSPCRNGAWQGLMASEDAWAVALEKQLAGQPFDLTAAARMAGDLHTSYCALRGAVPDGVTLPDPPSFLTCGQASSGPPSGAPSVALSSLQSSTQSSASPSPSPAP